jgi:hypothetical protein
MVKDTKGKPPQINGSLAVKQKKSTVSISADIISTAANISVKLMELMFPSFSLNLPLVFSKEKREKAKKEIQEEKIKLFTELANIGINISIYEQHLNNELNRKLKKIFGGLFLIFAFIFTILSYLIVILDAILHWGINQVAVTALIIEIPLQFVSILLIIANNLFPSHTHKQ